MKEIDFDKLLNDFLERYKEKNPNPDNDPYIAMAATTARISAQACVSILKDYEKMKNS